MQAIGLRGVFTFMELKPEAVREANLRIRAAALRLDELAAEIEWDFLCECGEATCMEFVGLPMREFERLLAAQGAVIASGHAAQLARRALSG